MKILVLSNIIAGGEWIAVQTLIKKLHKINDDFEFYLITSASSKRLIEKNLFIKIYYSKVRSFKKPLKKYRELFYQIHSGAKTIDKACHNNNYDVVIAIDYLLTVSYVLSQKKLDYIFYFHGIKNYYKIFFETSNHYMIFRKFLEIGSWIMSRSIIIPSINAKKTMEEHSFYLVKLKSTKIIPNLIRDEFSKAGTQKKKNNILYSGRLDYLKGIENLITAFTLISKKFRKLYLTIVYPGRQRLILKRLIIKTKSSSRIIFIENPTLNQLVSIYKSSRLAVLPSMNEVSSLFLRESLVSNLPIISTSKGDAKTILSKCFIINDNDVGSLYRKIVDFFNNEAKYRKKYQEIVSAFKFHYNEGYIISNWIKIIKQHEK